MRRVFWCISNVNVSRTCESEDVACWFPRGVCPTKWKRFVTLSVVKLGTDSVISVDFFAPSVFQAKVCVLPRE